MSSLTECSVCFAEKGKPIKCPFCEYMMCTGCCRAYILQSINDACCMNCRKTFERSVIIDLLGNNWYASVYKPSREDVMFNNQKALFNETLPFVHMHQEISALEKELEELEKEKSELDDRYMSIKKNIINEDEYRDRLSNFTVLMRQLRLNNVSHDKMDELEEIDLRRIKICRMIPQIKKTIKHYKTSIKTGRIVPQDNDSAQNTDKKDKNNTYFPCPYDGCSQGIVNITTATCTSCRNKACIECQERFDDDNHKCNPIVLKNITYIQKSSKQCPKCCAYIHRTLGCPQMWCTSCHTFFNYNTGELYKKPVHNPHYTEWIQKNIKYINRPGGRGDCDFTRHIASSRKVSAKCRQELVGLYGSIQHIQQDIIERKLTTAINQYSPTNLKHLTMRIKYLTGQITEQRFRQFLFQEYKHNLRCIDIRGLLLLVVESIIAIIDEMILENNRDTMVSKLSTLNNYVQDQINRIDKLYSTKSIKFLLSGIDDHKCQVNVRILTR